MQLGGDAGIWQFRNFHACIFWFIRCAAVYWIT